MRRPHASTQHAWARLPITIFRVRKNSATWTFHPARVAVPVRPRKPHRLASRPLSGPRAPLGAESLRGRASPFGVPSASLRLSRLLPPRPRRRHVREVGLRPSSLGPSPPPVVSSSRGEVEGVVKGRVPERNAGHESQGGVMQVHFVARENGPERLVTEA